MKPEEKARLKIDELLEAAGWNIQDLKHPLITDGLWKTQIAAIQNLEKPFADAHPRALIQMATGSSPATTRRIVTKEKKRRDSNHSRMMTSSNGTRPASTYSGSETKALKIPQTCPIPMSLH